MPKPLTYSHVITLYIQASTDNAIDLGASIVKAVSQLETVKAVVDIDVDIR